MDYFTKKNVLIWVVIILLIVNISAIATIFIQVFSDRRPECGFFLDEPPKHIVKKLKPDEEQIEYFSELHNTFREQTRDIIIRLNEKREEMLTELSSNDPDTVRLKEIAEEYGKLHKHLKMNTIDHFLKMKKKCTPSQEKELNKFINEILSSNGPWHDRFIKHMHRRKSLNNIRNK